MAASTDTFVQVADSKYIHPGSPSTTAPPIATPKKTFKRKDMFTQDVSKKSRAPLLDCNVRLSFLPTILLLIRR
jgi:hypothetical protein